MKSFTYPPKFRPLSSCVMLVRPRGKDSKRKSEFDYEILILKRAPNISFGNLWAFPGGVVEE